ncbi:MAG: SusC/RagA family TonB-linked outer membrane protein [Saprospiraceae bacterium]|nr:SusC/RagA family TonB-linked outer membrane protein [Candidatus Vicinibacter proximus]MBL7822844.1 SusC/RagA family TonB-linked outer membrane protein [Saprospiraceae bacterium]MCC6842777.1 SusC/RagA family TonB-linked outer membrane protein [Saprospiraceae bacterium]HRG34501.1 SusC/RagA family TonB-linked outer membrane protein [Saprospiraceae bacterium]
MSKAKNYLFMHHIKSGFITLVFLLFTSQLFSQETTLFGIVKDAKNNAVLEGVNVVMKGGGAVANTNVLGEFSIQVPNKFPLSLTFSYLGYSILELNVNEPGVITVLLEPEYKELNEVMVVSGYTVQKKSEFSGAVSKIGSEELLNRPASSFDQLLGGRAAGIEILQPSNILNNTPILRIRGINSITSGIFPLVVVDGVTVFVGSIGGFVGNNPLSDINPSDIQTIDVLKDASAAAIFGSRAANGVMVITTKKGKKGRVKINYDSWVSRSTPYNLPELLNAEDYVTIKNEAMVNSGRAPGYFLMKNPDGSTVNTSWYDVAYRPGWSHNHNFNVSGANNSTNYFFSFGYTDQNNFIRYNSFERYSTRLNIDNQINDYIKIGANLSYSNGLNKGPNTGAIASNTLASSSYNSEYITNEPLARMTFVLPPNVPVYNADGSYSIQNGNSVGYGLNNPSTIGTINAYNLALVQKLDVNTSENNTFLGNVFAEWKILNNLTFRTSYGLNNLQVQNKSFLNPLHGGGASANGSATNVFSKYYRADWVNTLNYNKAFADVHNLGLLVGYERIHTTIDSWGAQRTNITDPDYSNYQGGFVNIAPIGNVYSENALLSYFSNLTYDFDRRYLLSFNFRRDGLSALSAGNKYGNFLGGSLGWNVSRESFFQESSLRNWVSNLKLRASYGIVGNSEIGDYPAIGAYTSSTYGGSATLNYAQAGNPDLKWETSTKLDLGFDLTLFNDRLGIEFDYYKNLIDDLILKAPQALSTGIPGGFINANVGSMYNEGVELGIYGVPVQKGDFKWDLNFNMATLTNKVTSLVSDVYVPSIFGVQNMTRVGYSIGSIFAVPTVGVNPDNGLMVFVNSEGREVQYNHIGSPRWTYLDGTAAPAIDNYKDGVIQGPSLPKLFGGINNRFTYKNFDLDVNFTYVMGNKLYNGTRATNSDQRYFNNGTFIKERWTTPGQKTEIQKLYYGDNVSAGFSFSATSKVENGDYLKLKNIALGYKIPLKARYFNGKISSARVYFQASNVFTLTKYRGSDPEVSINGNSIHSGKDQNVPPNAQVMSVGLNVGF